MEGPYLKRSTRRMSFCVLRLPSEQKGRTLTASYCSYKHSPSSSRDTLTALQGGFSHCVNVLSFSSKPDEMAVDVCTHICRCYRVSAQFEGCREAIVEVPAIVKDLCRVLYFKNLPRLNCVAAQTVAEFACDEWLQTNLLHAGVLWHLILFVLCYDYTLDAGGVETSDETNQQEVANNLARLSIIAIAKLTGYKFASDVKTPDNPTIQNIIRALFTPYLTKAISRNTSNELLKLLNSNTENPYLIWDNRTRAELTKYLEEQQQAMVHTGESEVMAFGENFMYSTLKDELVIGEVYVRVYNEQPTFVLEVRRLLPACVCSQCTSLWQTRSPL